MLSLHEGLYRHLRLQKILLFRGFLELLNFYRKFLRFAAGVLAFLTDALKGPGKSLDWSPALDSAFRLCQGPPRLLPWACSPLSCYSDLSCCRHCILSRGCCSAAALEWVFFFFKKLSDAERKYTAFNRELLVAYFSLHHFCFMLEGREFTTFTNCKLLTVAFF